MRMEDKSGLLVAEPLVRFIEEQVLPGTGLDVNEFWSGVAGIFASFTSENRRLLAERDRIQKQIDDWHGEHPGQPDQRIYENFLREIGYLAEDPDPFQINPGPVDEEIAEIAGPQLVVPVLNARFLLNAANARWGSLYDALYGTDALTSQPAPAHYDAARGEAVVAYAKAFLDRAVPLAAGSWVDFKGGAPDLADPSQLVGWAGDTLLFRHHGLHIELVIDPGHPVGAVDPAGIADVMLESALTTIVDLEDSVAAVDAEDKVAAYTNWLGLMRGDLEVQFEKGDRIIRRSLAQDRTYQDASGSQFSLRGRALLLVRNVGHLMTTPAISLPDGSEAPEGILDAIVTTLVGLHDLLGVGRIRNSLAGSIYIVKPKMHGPQEVAFTRRMFDAVEDLLGLGRNTIKLGLMDEERRTSANLAACIREVKDRIVFINTGFLDRTGDEIHTSMRAGAVVRKAEMKESAWIKAYEDRNVLIGLATGFSGRAQIGKGMWAAPDRMADMMEQKGVHPASGANTAWVPSPTAATLHAIHYHDVDVFSRQAARREADMPALHDLLTPPLAIGRNWSSQEVREELDNNVQSILGYVVRWVDQGIGCSKVPDIRDVGLMEDRATLRISAQHLANWLMHGICSAEDVDAAFQRMAAKVDVQNTGDPSYRPLLRSGGPTLAFETARALVFAGVEQPNGYTEPLLHNFRRQVKERSGERPWPG